MSATLARERLAQARVLVVGDAMLDRYWFGAVERISPEAPVPIVRVNASKHEERLGGAANVAWNVQSLGAKASLLTAIGDDEHGHRLEGLLDKERHRDALQTRSAADDDRQAARHRSLAAVAANRFRRRARPRGPR